MNLGNLQRARMIFGKIVHNKTEVPQLRDAQVRLIRVLVHLELWDEAGREADALLSRDKDLKPLESVVARGARALKQLQQGDLDRAERDVDAALSIIEERQFNIPSKIHRDVAVAYFALGELRRRRADAVRFVPLPAAFADQLERRCQLLLDAQSAYSTSMRAYDAHWSVMAGYRVGELYAQLHADLMDLLAATAISDPASERLFEAALRLRYTVLLSKAVTLLEHTLAVAARTGEDSQWVKRAREARESLEASLSREQAALDLVPYSREQLEAALANLNKSHAIRASGAQSHSHSM